MLPFRSSSDTSRSFSGHTSPDFGRRSQHAADERVNVRRVLSFDCPKLYAFLSYPCLCQTKEAITRLLVLAALAVSPSSWLSPPSDMPWSVPGVSVRAGCAGPRGALVVRRPVVVCHTVIVNGVRVRRCG